VWMDFLCVPQAFENRAKQQAAINSLPHYIKSSGNVFIMVGEEGESRYEVYSGRGWCRLERVCACIAIKGRDPEGEMYGELDYPVDTSIFVCNKNLKTEEKVSALELLKMGDYDPMDGIFFDETDKMKIAPILKLLANHIETSEPDEEMSKMAQELLASAAKYEDGSIFENKTPIC